MPSVAAAVVAWLPAWPTEVLKGGPTSLRVLAERPAVALRTLQSEPGFPYKVFNLVKTL